MEKSHFPAILCCGALSLPGIDMELLPVPGVLQSLSVPGAEINPFTGSLAAQLLSQLIGAAKVRLCL